MYNVGDIFEPYNDPSRTFRIIAKYDNQKEFTYMIQKALIIGNVNYFIENGTFPLYLIKEMHPDPSLVEIIIVNDADQRFDDWEKLVDL